MKECPTCHRPFEQKGRLCFACGRPIKRTHKWHSEGFYHRHNDCANPEMDVAHETPLLAHFEPDGGTHAENPTDAT